MGKTLMTRTMKTLKGLLALLVSMTMVVALGTSLFAFAADTVTETVVVQQTITPDTTPKRNSYTYVLTPKRAENPMPAGAENGQYTLPVIKGSTTDATAPSFTFEIDVSKPGVYEYILGKVETTPEGDTFSPESHIFGYKVEVDEKTGELVAIPYICQSGDPIFTDPDENGYPTKIILANVVTGTKNTTKTTASTTTTTKKGYTTRTYSTRTVTRATYVTTARGGRVNTGDESQLLLWVAVLGVASLGLIILILARRRKDDDDENTL